jgi:hypothetical protein
MDKSPGTKEFIAKMDRLLGKCTKLAGGRHGLALVCEAFERLFSVAGKIDESPDDVIFFADEAGVWQLGIDWRAVLTAYFHCLVATTDANEYAKRTRKTTDSLPTDERRKALAAARKVARANR